VSPVKYGLGFYIPEDGILHSHCRENFKSYTALTGWAQLQRRMSPMRYELGFCIPADGIFHSHRRENLKSYIYLRCCKIQTSRRWGVFHSPLFDSCIERFLMTVDPDMTKTQLQHDRDDVTSHYDQAPASLIWHLRPY
jgi:hypothetical protein